MHTRSFRPAHVLKGAIGTQVLAEYCHTRAIPYHPPSEKRTDPENVSHWLAALNRLPTSHRTRIEWELTQVEEMAHPDAISHLREVAIGLRPPPEHVPTGAALALWYLVHHPELFQRVFLAQQALGGRTGWWRIARAPPQIAIARLPFKAARLTQELRRYFLRGDGTGRFCTVEAERVGKVVCFIASLADRPHLVETFTERGKPVTQRVRPAVPLIFAYDPRDGAILLRSGLRSRDRILDLVCRFARVVLQTDLTEDCLAPAFDLRPLKGVFAPLPDAPDMHSVRLKTLHLRYPDRAGRRVVKFETHAGDGPSAVPDMLKAHLSVAGVLEQLDVCYAELQVRLRVEGGDKSYVIRLSPDRCNLDRNPLGERLRACLRRWGLCYA